MSKDNANPEQPPTPGSTPNSAPGGPPGEPVPYDLEPMDAKPSAEPYQPPPLLSDFDEDADTKHLHLLRGRIGKDLIDAVLVYAGEHAYRRRDGVAAVQLALLGR